jgi:2-hydroxychromene-2-carboxylate isomerase
MPATVDFYFDYGSPTAYLAWTQLGRICAKHGAALNLKPFVLGAVFKATGNAAPATVPAKGRYLFVDCSRWAAKWGVPIKMNPYFPINTVDLMKAGVGVQLRMPDRFDAFSRAIFTAIWVDARNLNDREVAVDVLKAADFDPAAIFELVGDAEVRAAVRANSEEAVARGAFGAPTFFVGEEMYFGQDRLEMVEEAIVRRAA